MMTDKDDLDERARRYMRPVYIIMTIALILVIIVIVTSGLGWWHG